MNDGAVGDPLISKGHTVFASGVNKEFISKNRRYLPTLSDLVDRLAIVQLKTIFISEHRDEYMKERADIEHDIDLILEGKTVTAVDIHAIMVIMLSNRFIWENEAKARNGGVFLLPVGPHRRITFKEAMLRRPKPGRGCILRFSGNTPGYESGSRFVFGREAAETLVFESRRIQL